MRTAEIARETRETKIKLSLNLDGNGINSVHTGVGFFDHMLEQIGKRGAREARAQGVLGVGERGVEHAVDAPSRRAGGRWVLVEAEEAVGALCGLEGIKQGDRVRGTGERGAAHARLHGDDPRLFELAERAPDDHGAHADACRDEVRGGLLLALEGGDAEPACGRRW